MQVIGHCTLASILWHRANAVNLEDNASVTSFYMSIWKVRRVAYFIIRILKKVLSFCKKLLERTFSRWEYKSYKMSVVLSF